MLFFSYSPYQQHRHQLQAPLLNHPYRLDQLDRLSIVARKKFQATNKLAAGNYSEEHKVLENYFKFTRER